MWRTPLIYGSEEWYSYLVPYLVPFPQCTGSLAHAHMRRHPRLRSASRPAASEHAYSLADSAALADHKNRVTAAQPKPYTHHLSIFSCAFFFLMVPWKHTPTTARMSSSEYCLSSSNRSCSVLQTGGALAYERGCCRVCWRGYSRDCSRDCQRRAPRGNRARTDCAPTANGVHEHTGSGHHTRLACCPCVTHQVTHLKTSSMMPITAPARPASARRAARPWP